MTLPLPPGFFFVEISIFGQKEFLFLFWFQFVLLFFKSGFFCLAADSDGSSKNLRAGGKAESTPLSRLLQKTAPLKGNFFFVDLFTGKKNIWPVKEKKNEENISRKKIFGQWRRRKRENEKEESF